MLRLATSHSPVFLLNSCLDLFSAPPPAFPGEGPLSLSYGASLPSSLAVSLSSASVSSTRPPVSVSGTGPSRVGRPARFFSGVCSSAAVAPRLRFAYCRVSPGAFPPPPQATSLQRAVPSARGRFAPPSPLGLPATGLRNLDRMSIRSAVPGLR